MIDPQTITHKRTYRVRVYVGPCQVDRIALMMRLADFTVPIIGTEHVHVMVSASDRENVQFTFLDSLDSKLGHHFGIRPTDIYVQEVMP